MKNKQATQIEAKEVHKKKLQADKRKKRGAEPLLDRQDNSPVKLDKPKILIVCEGKNTEPSYFNQFKLSSATIEAVGFGKNTITLVEHIIKNYDLTKYDEVWCVFDKDDFPNCDFDNAIKKAVSKNIKVAYSNQAFEYWLILHFEDHPGVGMHRKDYDKKINGYINPDKAFYDGTGNKIISEDFFDILLEVIDIKSGKKRVELAIERAKKIHNGFAPHKSPAKEESSTTVFLLVETLLKYI